MLDPCLNPPLDQGDFPVFDLNPSDATRVHTTAGVEIRWAPSAWKHRTMGMTTDKDLILRLHPSQNLPFNSLSPLIVLRRARNVVEAKELEILPEISREESGKPPKIIVVEAPLVTMN